MGGSILCFASCIISCIGCIGCVFCSGSPGCVSCLGNSAPSDSGPTGTPSTPSSGATPVSSTPVSTPSSGLPCSQNWSCTCGNFPQSSTPSSALPCSQNWSCTCGNFPQSTTPTCGCLSKVKCVLNKIPQSSGTKSPTGGSGSSGGAGLSGANTSGTNTVGGICAASVLSSVMKPAFLCGQASMLVNRGVSKPSADLQASLQQMDPALVGAFSNAGIPVAQMMEEYPQGYASGSSVTGDMPNLDTLSNIMSGCMSYNDTVKYLTPCFPECKTTVLEGGVRRTSPLTLAALKHLSPQIGSMGGLAKGGLPHKYHEAAPEGHHPEFVTGLTGYYAGGRGTGQSDDIPAMLHDGDYVIDADAVAAFGDGSSKAGHEALMKFMHQVPHDKRPGGNPVPAKIADGEVVLPESFVTALGGGDNKHGAKMLDEMRKRLREHKRSAPDSKIPPKAKSPLEYLKGSKG